MFLRLCELLFASPVLSHIVMSCSVLQLHKGVFYRFEFKMALMLSEAFSLVFSEVVCSKLDPRKRGRCDAFVGVVTVQFSP